MPIPTPADDESRDDFVGRCMSDSTMIEDFADTDQRLAVCESAYDQARGAVRCWSGTKPEWRAADGSSCGTLCGYAAVYNSLSVDFGGWHEIVMPGAFDRSLSDGDDVVARAEHQSGTSILGRRSNGTLKLKSDRTGLYYEIRPPDTSVARDIAELVRRGDMKSSSFAFIPREGGQKWDDGDPAIRRLTDVQLFDVAPVGDPAYPKSQLWIEDRQRTIHEAQRAIAKMRSRHISVGKELRQRIRELDGKYKPY